jgi:hypothetical protein
MSTPNIPSKSPAIDGDLGGALSFIFRKLMMKVDGQLPAKVISYNRMTNRAMVQPLISIIGTNGQRVGRAPIAAVPVLALGGGNFFVNFPLGPGDVGWIEASDRDISLYLQGAQQSSPYDGRIHSFENGRFVPDVFDNYTFTPDASSMVISSLDGSTRIVISEGKINLIAPDVQINSQTVEINASTSVTVNTGAYNINATGSGTEVTGTVTLPVNTTIAGVPFPTHEHSGVQTGGGNTGGVVGA